MMWVRSFSTLFLVLGGTATAPPLLRETNLNAGGPKYVQQRTAPSGTRKKPDVTQTTMRVIPDPVGLGRDVTVTVTVMDTTALGTTAEGEVTFTDTVGVTHFGDVRVGLNDGKAALTMIPTRAGVHTVTAHYAGVNEVFLRSMGQATFTVQP